MSSGQGPAAGLTAECHIGPVDDAAASDYLRNALYYQYNHGHIPITFAHVNIYLRDEAGTLQGGLLAEHYWDCLFIDVVWIAPPYRRMGYGTMLVRQVEAIARERGVNLIHLDTHDFQAPDFYGRLGYSIFGVLEGSPRGHNRYYMAKRLNDPASSGEGGGRPG